MPAISVLLPVRDAGVYLAPALASLWRQSCSDFEVVAVNDGSSDGSGERLERAAAREPRLRVVHTPPLGLPAALNRGLAEARSPLIARQDADEAGARLAKLPRVLYGWRQHGASATRRDPRYERARFVALKCAALARGRLGRASEVTLIGTGRSLEEWRAALAHAGLAARTLRAGHPAHAGRLALRPPLLLVFGTEPARARWRAALVAWRFNEGGDFTFVA